MRNWPLLVGVDMVGPGDLTPIGVGESVKSDSLSDVDRVESRIGLSSSAKQFVVAQNKKLPRMLP